MTQGIVSWYMCERNLILEPTKAFPKLPGSVTGHSSTQLYAACHLRIRLNSQHPVMCICFRVHVVSYFLTRDKFASLNL